MGGKIDAWIDDWNYGLIYCWVDGWREGQMGELMD